MSHTKKFKKGKVSRTVFCHNSHVNKRDEIPIKLANVLTNAINVGKSLGMLSLPELKISMALENHSDQKLERS